MSMGEFVDLDTYLGDWETMHRAMAVLYRPITKEHKDTYQIEPYETSDKYAEVMKYVGLGATYGAMLFFWNLSRALTRASLASLEEDLTEEITAQLDNLAKSGDGTQASMLSLANDLIGLSKQPSTI